MQNIIKEIESTPGLIKQSELKILDFKNVIASNKQQMDTIRRTTACEVTSEMADGKKVFSNTEAREAETDKRLQKNEKYQELKMAMLETETEKCKEEINLRYITDTFSSNRYRVRLYTADKVEKAASNFLGAIQIVAGLSDLLSQFKIPTQATDLDVFPDDCPF